MAAPTDLLDALAAVAPNVPQDAPERTPLPPIPSDVVLTPEEKEALTKPMEYSRGGTLNPPIQITRQQFIEDVLMRGFTKAEVQKRGPFSVVRLTNPKFNLRKRNYYDFQSAVERGYVMKRLAAALARAKHEREVKLTALEPEQGQAPAMPAASAAAPAVPAPAEQAAPAQQPAPTPGRVMPAGRGRVTREIFERVLRSSGVAYTEDRVRFMIAPAPERGGEIGPDDTAGFTVEVTRQGQRSFMSERGTIEQMIATALRVAFAAAPSVETAPLPPAETVAVEPTAAGSVDAPVPKPAEVRELTPEERDFSYAAGQVLTPRGNKAKLAANIAAIRLAKKLTAEGRHATPEEKGVLAQYSGWGGLKDVFNTVNERYREYKKRGQGYYIPDDVEKWEKEYGAAYDAVKELLSPDEWEAAAASTLNAHYTDEAICHELWAIARRAGFAGGRVREPGCGVGRIIGAMPADLREKSSVVAIEQDSISAEISKHLFPQAEIQHGDYTDDTFVRPNSVDLVVANVPFSDTPPANQHGDVEMNLHNFFISRALDELKPGGLAVVITSASTLENNQSQRSALADKGELLGAIRLPNDAFAASANTEVVTDILLLRKPDLANRVETQDWRFKLPVDLPKEGRYMPKYKYDPEKDEIRVAEVNEYFVNHPEMVLGYHSMKGKMYGGGGEEGQYTVESPQRAAPVVERLREAIAQLPERVPNSSLRRDDPVAEMGEEQTEKLMALADETTDSLVERNGVIYAVSEDRELVSPPWRQKGDGAVALPKGLTADEADEMAKAYAKLRGAMKRVIATDLSPIASEQESEAARLALRTEYERFTAEHGQLNTTKNLLPILGGDPDFGSVLALEDVREVKVEGTNRRQKVVAPAAMLTRRTLVPAIVPTHAASVAEAINISLAQRGVVDVKYVADLLGKEDIPGVENAIEQSDLAFRNPESGMYESKAQYLSGPVRSKLDVAKRAAEQDARYQRNVAALTAVNPPDVPFEQINVPMGATWVPTALYEEFANEVLEQHGVHIRYYPVLSKFEVVGLYPNQVSRSAWGTKEMDGTIIFEHALAQKHIRILKEARDENGRIVRKENGDAVMVFDEKASAKANERAEAMRARWKTYIRDNPQRQKRVSDEFNRRFTGHVVPQYDGSYLSFPGMATGPGALVPRDHQRSGVARMLQEMQGLLAHGVGAGKTLEGIAIAFEAKRMKLANKPMIVCDNANYAQFVEAYRKIYPGARLLASDETSMTPRNRERFKARIATGEFDTVLMARSHFERIPVSLQTQQRYIAQEIAELREAVEQAKMREKQEGRLAGRGGAVRQIQKRIEKAKERLKGVTERIKERGDDGLTWEQLGVDFAIVDECFPWETYVLTEFGLLPIGLIVDLRLAVRVLSVDTKTGKPAWKQVVNWHRMPLVKKLVRVHHEDGSFVCTEDHKIWTHHGYVKAGQLRAGDKLVACAGETTKRVLEETAPRVPPMRSDDQWVRNKILLPELLLRQCAHSTSVASEAARGAQMSRLRGDVCFDAARGTGAGGEVLLTTMQCREQTRCEADDPHRVCLVRQDVREAVPAADATLLRNELLCEVAHATASHHGAASEAGTVSGIASTIRQMAPYCETANERTESVVGDRGSREIIGGGEKAARSVVHRQTRRERNFDGTPIDAVPSARLANGSSGRHSACEGYVPEFAALLPRGRWEREKAYRNRGGWADAPVAQVEVSGSEKGGCAKSPRVVRVEVYERASDAGFGFSDSPSDFVYDIEVEDNHNFFAEGVLVSNCHREKKIGLQTSHTNIKGIDTNASQRGRMMMMKLRHIQDKRDGKGGIGMTGTPVTNTMAEAWTQTKLFAPSVLEQFNVEHFDDFKSAFTTTVLAMEMNEANGKWRTVERLAKFINGIPLIQMVRTGMDVQMDLAGLNLSLPKIKTGGMQVRTTPLSDTVADKMDELAELYEKYEKSNDKAELSWVPLVLMQMGLAASIDPRLIDPNAPDDPDSLANCVAKEVAERYHATKAKKSTQVVFLDRYGSMDTSILRKLKADGADSVQLIVDDDDDLSRLDIEEEGEAEVAESESAAKRTKASNAAEPAPVKDAPRFNLYKDLRAKLVKLGIPENEIAIIQDAKTPADRAAMLERVNEGAIRVIFGSSDKLGIGSNFQRKLLAAHHFDPPRFMTPDQLDQRNGRIWRQGNENEEIEQIAYGMEDTVTPATIHRLGRKQAFTRQVLAGKGVGMEFEDTGEIRLEDMKAALIRDKRQFRRAELLAEIRDEKMKAEIIGDRSRHVHGMRARTLEMIADYEAKVIPDAKNLAAHFAQTVVAPNDNTTEWSYVWAGKAVKGPPKEIMKSLTTLVDQWKEVELKATEQERTLGTIAVNGLPMRIFKQDGSIIDNGESRLMVAIHNPLKPSETLDAPRRFGSSEMLYKLCQTHCERVAAKGAEGTRAVEGLRAEVVRIDSEIAKLESFDPARLDQLQKELEALEADMLKNPYKRGQNRRGKNGAQAQTTTETQQTATAPARADSSSSEAILYGRRNGSEEWQEEILSTRPAEFERVKKLAEKDGFAHFRVAKFNGEKPNFAAAVKPNAAEIVMAAQPAAKAVRVLSGGGIRRTRPPRIL